MASFELRSLWLFSALLIASSFAAHAQQASPGPQGVQAELHATTVATSGVIAHNRTTTKELDAAFNRGDTDHNGKLDRQEAERFPALAQRFDKIDTDHDHFISRAEFRRAAGAD
ncbi:MAG: EF-hand domain-containing protein [Polaromonas sp.]